MAELVAACGQTRNRRNKPFNTEGLDSHQHDCLACRAKLAGMTVPEYKKYRAAQAGEEDPDAEPYGEVHAMIASDESDGVYHAMGAEMSGWLDDDLGDWLEDDDED